MIKLEIFSESYLDNTFEWMQNQNLKRAFLLDKKITEVSHRDWFEEVKKDDSQRIFAILHKEVHVGNIGIKNIEREHKKAEIWIYIGNNSFSGKGLGTSALIQLNEKFQGEYHKFYAQIADFNIVSIKTFTKAGYKLEGILHNELIFRGEFVNIYRFCSFL